MSRIKHIIRTLPALGALLISACFSTVINQWPTITGQVIDEATGEAVLDAVVMARWMNPSSQAPESIPCFHVETTLTDASGTFTIPAWRSEGYFSVGEWQLVALDATKPGYQYSLMNTAPANKNHPKDVRGKPDTPPDAISANNIVFIKKDDRPADERLADILLDYKQCPSARESEKNRRLWLVTNYQYALELLPKVKDPDAFNTPLESYLRAIEIIDYGHDESLKRAVERNRIYRERKRRK